jgi:ketosteroid isomerase-like protein
MAAMPQGFASKQDANKAIVQASFDRWRSGTGGPFELLVPEAEWTIVGSSPLSKTYQSRQEFLDKVITPFKARMMKPLVQTVRGILRRQARRSGRSVARGWARQRQAERLAGVHRQFRPNSF